MNNDGITFVQTSRLFRNLMDFFNILPKRHYKNNENNQITRITKVTKITKITKNNKNNKNNKNYKIKKSFKKS